MNSNTGLKIGIVAAAVVLAPLAVLCLGQMFVPGGFEHETRDARAEIEAAHGAGRYAEVVRLYETPLRVPLFPDIALADRRGRQFYTVKVMAGDAYTRRGEDEKATVAYLSVLGWDENRSQFIQQR